MFHAARGDPSPDAAEPNRDETIAARIRIRQARAEDAMAVAQAHVRSWQVGYRGLIAQEYLDALDPVDRAKRYSFDRAGPHGPFTQVAVDGETVCGHVTTGSCRDDDLQGDGETWAIYVDPPRWSAGIGRHLMAAGCDHLLSRGHTAASLWVLSGNSRARRFYELAGWDWDGTRRTDVIGSDTVDEVRYRRSLNTTAREPLSR